MRVLPAVIVSLTLGLFISVADDKKPTPPGVARARRLKELEKRFDDEVAELNTRFERAKTPRERDGLVTEAKEVANLITGKLYSLIEDDPRDTVAFEAFDLIVRKTAFGGAKEVSRAVALMAENQIDNPKIAELFPAVARLGPAGRKLLETAAVKAATQESRGLASFFLGVLEATDIDFVEDPQQQEAAINRAIQSLERAVKEAPEAAVGNSTIAKQAVTELEGLKAAAALLVGKPAPDIESQTLDGQPAKLSASRGKVILLDFWATTCGPCRSMIPHERELVKRMQGRPFELISISGDAQKATLVQFLAREPMPWTHWWKDGGSDKPFEVYRAYSFPTVFLIDHTGTIRARWKTPPKPAELDKLVDQLVKEAEKKG